MQATRPVNNNAQGWGFAALIVLLAIVCATAAWWIHTETWCNPRDPMCRAAEVHEGGH